CGSRIQCRYVKQPSGKKYRLYLCMWAAKTLSPEWKIPERVKKLQGGRCTLPNMNAERLEQRVFSEIYKFFMFPEQIIHHLEKTTDQGHIDSLKVELTDLNQRMKKRGAELERYTRRYGQGKISDAVLDKLAREIENEAAKYQSRKTQIQSELSLVDKKESELAKMKLSYKDFKKIADGVKKVLDNLSGVEKREFLQRAFGGQPLYVRPLYRADDMEDQKIEKEDYNIPLMRKYGARAVQEVTVEASMSYDGLLNGLDYLKNKGLIKLNYKPLRANSKRWDLPPSKAILSSLPGLPSRRLTWSANSFRSCNSASRQG
ncbi:MAG: hypothetical protein NTY64_05735, partial [Deltaproteobacteria bacterium]|nr:hypothetical protein [Deltaproteobacteria bacterium]